MNIFMLCVVSTYGISEIFYWILSNIELDFIYSSLKLTSQTQVNVYQQHCYAFNHFINYNKLRNRIDVLIMQINVFSPDFNGCYRAYFPYNPHGVHTYKDFLVAARCCLLPRPPRRRPPTWARCCSASPTGIRQQATRSKNHVAPSRTAC